MPPAGNCCETQRLREMDITTSAGDFIAFLFSCTAQDNSKQEPFIYDIKIGEKSVEISACLLPPLAHSPLSEITGPLQCPTVILTSTEQLKDVEKEEESPELKAILDQFSDSVLEDERKEGGAHSRDNHVKLVEKETIFVGQELSRKRKYLKQEVNIHPGRSHTVITHADLSLITPLSLDLARALVSFYLVGSRAQSVSLPALWVPCTQSSTDSAVREDIVGFGCTFEQEQEDHCLRVYCVRDKGMGRNDGARKRMSDFKKINLQGSSAFARYEMMSSEIAPVISGAEMSIEFAWDDPSSPLSRPPTIGTDGLFNVAIEPGNLQCTLNMFNEIKTLLRLCQSLQQEGSYFIRKEEEREGISRVNKEETLLVDKVDDFLESIDIPLSHTLQVNVVSPSIESSVYKLRENLDFTESLWLFVKDVQTAEDLQATLSSIFKSVLLGKVKNINVRNNSSSTLAILLHELEKCKSVSDRQTLAPKFQLLLSITKSLHFLAQVGIEKLKRDMRGFLISTMTLNEGDYEDFFKGGENDGEIINQCHSVCNLYHVIELVATLVNYHTVPSLSLSALAKAAMEFYKQRLSFTGFERTPLFSVALSRNSTVLRPIIDMCTSSGSPTLWCATSKNGDMMNIISTVAFNSRGDGRQHFYEVTCREV